MPTNPDPTPPSRIVRSSNGGLLAKLQQMREIMQQLHDVMGEVEDALCGEEGLADEDALPDEEDDEGAEIQEDEATGGDDNQGPVTP